MKDKSVMSKALDELFKRNSESLSLKTALQVIDFYSFREIRLGINNNMIYWYTLRSIEWAFDKGGYTLVRKSELEELRKLKEKYNE